MKILNFLIRYVQKNPGCTLVEIYREFQLVTRGEYPNISLTDLKRILVGLESLLVGQGFLEEDRDAYRWKKTMLT